MTVSQPHRRTNTPNQVDEPSRNSFIAYKSTQARELLDDLIAYSGGRFGFFMSFVLPVIAMMLSLCAVLMSLALMLGWWS
jgi:hypothetical protein